MASRRPYADVIRDTERRIAIQKTTNQGPTPRTVTPPINVAARLGAYLQRDSVPDPVDCAYAWADALPADAWGYNPMLVRQIVDHVPSERILAAFERDPRLFAESDRLRRERLRSMNRADTPSSHGPDDDCDDEPVTPIATLYGLCVRMLVPFAVADAMLQARLPMLAGTVYFAHETTPRSAQARIVRAPPDSLPCQQRVYDTWWVSCCGCDRRSGRPCTTPCFDVLCPRGWFRRVHERDALRIMAWHWGDQIDIRHGSRPGRHNKGERYCSGLYEHEWQNVTGRFESLSLGRTTTNDGTCAVMVSCSCMVISCLEDVEKCAGVHAQAASMARIHHPWDSRISVSHRTDRGVFTDHGGWHILSIVEGDNLFAAETFP